MVPLGLWFLWQCEVPAEQMPQSRWNLFLSVGLLFFSHTILSFEGSAHWVSLKHSEMFYMICGWRAHPRKSSILGFSSVKMSEIQCKLRESLSLRPLLDFPMFSDSFHWIRNIFTAENPSILDFPRVVVARKVTVSLVARLASRTVVSPLHQLGIVGIHWQGFS